jgi:Domain of unknown function (DUF4351)
MSRRAGGNIFTGDGRYRKFGSIDSSIINRIQVLSTEELEVLGEEFLGFSDVFALLAWLDRSTGS